MQTNINYLLCGRLVGCKIKLYEHIIKSINDYQNRSFPIDLQFNHNAQFTISILPCSINPTTGKR